jgi:hypothetical protein
MGRPRLLDEPLTPAERQRRRRERKRLEQVRPAGYWAPAAPVTKAAAAVTKPPVRFDPRALIG